MFSGISAVITCYDNKYLTPDIMHSDYDQLYYVCMSPSTQKIRLEALFLGCLPICTYMHAYPNEGILLPSCCQHPVILYFRNASNEVHKNAR